MRSILGMNTRRDFITGLAAGTGWLGVSHSVAAASGWSEAFTDKVVAIEREIGGWLGVALIDIATGQQVGHRMAARFPMCSTFKALAAGAILKSVDEGKDKLDRRIKYDKQDLVTYSPATEKHVSDGMTLADICEAAITLSDNTAGNLMLASIGGPHGLTAFARSIGDAVTRLDRIETELNEATPGDPRDTTTPEAMAKNLNALVLGNVLSAGSKQQLTTWLVDNKTGNARLRAGLPGWRIGDKTGSGEHGTANDIAVLWPPGHAPMVATVYLTNTSASAERRNAAITDVGRAVWAAMQR
jgi:beta-lactamase class A